MIEKGTMRHQLVGFADLYSDYCLKLVSIFFCFLRIFFQFAMQSVQAYSSLTSYQSRESNFSQVLISNIFIFELIGISVVTGYLTVHFVADYNFY